MKLVSVSVKLLVEQAEKEIVTISTQDTLAAIDDPNSVIVDIRDIREIQREGRIPGSFHAPRGMLEFWIDTDSPYHKDIFSSGQRYIFYCNRGWRSALATKTAQDMGLKDVCHLGGGFEAWAEADRPIEKVERKK
jgi:rhodanese-related sulfurtransferase